MNYFKFNAFREDKPDWIYQQVLKGTAHFGWSEPGMDLRTLQKKLEGETPLNEAEKQCWRMTQFLVNRIRPGDRLIIQTERPLRRFLIAEVTGPYGFLGSEDDFNHYLECRAITENYIGIDAEFIPAWVKHDLRKRGQYYQIYRPATIQHFDSLIERKLWESPVAEKRRTLGLEKERMELDVIEKTIDIISTRWPGKALETFAKELFEKIRGVEVVAGSGDVGKGWDFLINIQDPLSDEYLHENVPVQCKNYSGDVDTDEPIDDLKRCVRNSESTIAYLVILGNLTDEFNRNLDDAGDASKSDLGRDVKFRTIDQDEIAKLYMKYMIS
ncbi:MAG: restriction endonuclease [Nitrospira sp.]|nr:restriction endonuclease [Nitrospira sp.]